MATEPFEPCDMRPYIDIIDEACAELAKAADNYAQAIKPNAPLTWEGDNA